MTDLEIRVAQYKALKDADRYVLIDALALAYAELAGVDEEEFWQAVIKEDGTDIK